ncbi:MAG: cytochrome c [Afipia sp.]|nr:cytochrome c [Afipia sp.]
MKRISIAAGVLLLGASAVLATPEGSALMKGNGKVLATVLLPTMKGDKPYVQADIDAALATLADTAAKLPTLYPDSAKTAAPSGDFGPSPKVFDDKAGFAAQIAAFSAAVTAAKGSAKDLNSFKASMPAIAKVCGDCHETYRVKNG